MVENEEENFSNFDLVFIAYFSSAVNLNLSQQEQHSFNKEVIFPSLVADIIATNFLSQQRDQLIIFVLANEGLLNEKVGEINKVFILVGEILEGDEVQDNIEVDLWVFTFKQEQTMANEFHLLEESGMIIFHGQFELRKAQRQFFDNCVFNRLDVDTEILVGFFKFFEF